MPRMKMSGPVSRYELDSKLKEQDTRLDGALRKILDVTQQTQTDNKAMEARFDAKFSSMKATMIVTAIATALTIVFGVGAINATLTSNMLAAFQAGAASHPPPAPQPPKPAPPAATTTDPTVATAT